MGGFSGKETVEASCTAYSPDRHSLSTFLAQINGPGLAYS